MNKSQSHSPTHKIKKDVGGDSQNHRGGGISIPTAIVTKVVEAQPVLIEETPTSPGKRRKAGNAAFAPKAGDLTRSDDDVDEAGARDFLSRAGWSEGLQSAFIKSCNKIPYRFVLVDDSGSMLTNDGKRLLKTTDGYKVIKCTRWSELIYSMQFHANLAHAAKAPTEFRLLNNAEPVLVGLRDDEGEGLSIAMRIFEEESPGGQTPLCQQIREVIEIIAGMADRLRDQGKRACVVIATDGESTDGDITEAMRPLQDLPVFVVLRLCTDEDAIVTYWNNIDENLELEMDVLDDFNGEAVEVRAVNPWLVYTEQLHRLREFGATMKEMDVIDEALLSSDQMAVMVSTLLFSGRKSDLPHPSEDWNGFLAAVKRQMSTLPLTYNPVTKKMETPLILPKLIQHYKGGGAEESSVCVLQ